MPARWPRPRPQCAPARAASRSVSRVCIDTAALHPARFPCWAERGTDCCSERRRLLVACRSGAFGASSPRRNASPRCSLTRMCILPTAGCNSPGAGRGAPRSSRTSWCRRWPCPPSQSPPARRRPPGLRSEASRSAQHALTSRPRSSASRALFLVRPAGGDSRVVVCGAGMPLRSAPSRRRRAWCRWS